MAQDAKRSLSAGEITKLLASGVSPARVADLVDQRGVSFEVTPAVKDQLRAAGAGSEVLGAVDRAALQAERRKLEAERKRMDEERKAGEAAAEAEKKRQAAADAGTAPVGSFPAGASPYGALDMIGNVWEWTSSPLEGGRAVRGASWYNKARVARASNRFWFDAASRRSDYGFRCAQ